MCLAAKRWQARAFPRIWTAIVAVNLVCGSLAAPAETPADGFVGSDACRSCHPDEYALWTQSDHYRSMRIATDATVLGDFAGAAVAFHDVETRFQASDTGRFHVDTVVGSGDRDRFPVRYTFGHWPLQQYLVDAGHGRLQAFGIAWDARPADQGGQRWFHLQPDEHRAGTPLPLVWPCAQLGEPVRRMSFDKLGQSGERRGHQGDLQRSKRGLRGVSRCGR